MARKLYEISSQGGTYILRALGFEYGRVSSLTGDCTNRGIIRFSD